MKTLLIIAAGIGSRYGGGIKQLDPVGPNGEIIADYSVYDAILAGFDHVVWVIRKETEDEFKKIIRKHGIGVIVYQDMFDLPNIDESVTHKAQHRTKPWGTAHAVWCARHQIKGPFTIINADDFYGRNAFKHMADQLGKYCIAGYRLDNTIPESGLVNRGICKIDKNNNLIELEENSGIRQHNGKIISDTYEYTGNELVSMNMICADTDLFVEIEKELEKFLSQETAICAEVFLTKVFNSMIDKKHIKVFPTSSKWFGMTYLEDKQTAMEKLRKISDIYPSPLW
jgi:NDP-sugar pyrophosphorylase family protein